MSQIQDLARGVKRGGLCCECGEVLRYETLRLGTAAIGAEYANTFLRSHSWIACLLSCKTKQANHKAAATKMSTGKIAGENAKPKLIARPTTVIKPASAKNSNEKARAEIARLNQSVAEL